MGFASRIWLTRNGQQVLADAQLGKELRFTKIVMGDGDIGGSAPSTMTDVVSPKLNLDIHEKLRMDAQTVYLRADYTNAVITQGFYFRELGLYADQGEGTTEVLYSYGNTGSLAEYIDAQSGPSTVEKVVALEITVNNATNVTAVFGSSTVYALQSDMESLEGEVRDILDGTKPAGKASEADKLATARTIAIAGGATGTATAFDGTKNITIQVDGLDMSKASQGLLAPERGGTGQASLQAARNTMGLGNTLGVLPVANGGTGNNAGKAADTEKMNAIAAAGWEPSHQANAVMSGTTLAINRAVTNNTQSETVYSVIFTAPADYVPGNPVTIDGVSVTVQDMQRKTLTPDNAWKSGARVELYRTGEYAFFKAGGGNPQLKLKIVGGLNPPSNPEMNTVWVRSTGDTKEEIETKSILMLPAEETSTLRITNFNAYGATTNSIIIIYSAIAPAYRSGCPWVMNISPDSNIKINIIVHAVLTYRWTNDAKTSFTWAENYYRIYNGIWSQGQLWQWAYGYGIGRQINTATKSTSTVQYNNYEPTNGIITKVANGASYRSEARIMSDNTIYGGVLHLGTDNTSDYAQAMLMSVWRATHLNNQATNRIKSINIEYYMSHVSGAGLYLGWMNWEVGSGTYFSAATGNNINNRNGPITLAGQWTTLNIPYTATVETITYRLCAMLRGISTAYIRSAYVAIPMVNGTTYGYTFAEYSN